MLKMDDSDNMTLGLRIQPFRILRIEPTGKPIDSPGMEQQGRIGPNILSFKHEVLRDPTRRLLYELSCPIDCPPSEFEALYAALCDDAASSDELLSFADRLWPLARANFVAHVVSHRPADAALLYALLESHASIDANAIYENLKAARAAAGIPAPSWISLHQGLDDLLKIHSAAAFVGYETIEGAIEPVLGCTRQVLTNGERLLVDALGSLLGPYREFIDPLQKDATEHIARACAAVREQSDDVSPIEQLASAVEAWMSTTQPLLIWSAYHAGRALDFDTPIKELRALIANLFENKQYDVASRVADVTRDLFRAVPTTLDQLVEDARLIEDLSLHAGIAQLQDAIHELESEPGPLIAALEQEGFGPTSTEPARRLWVGFLRTAQMKTRQAEVTAWRLMRDFAIRLSNRPEAAKAVARLIAGMIDYGERVSVAPQFLNALRDNLNFMKSFIGAEPVETRIVAGQTPSKRSLASIFFWKRSPRNSSENSRPKRHRMGWAALALLVAAACGSAAYLEFDQVRSLWSSWSEPALTAGRETMPPVGTGQHLALEGVRYCHFQQERLRFVKQQVQGPEDARAYNLLIVDYNSRCSDFFYQDNDLKIVLAEVDAKRKLLEADANRIISTWPGHTAQAEAGAGSIR
jgi:hypothetical protein